MKVLFNEQDMIDAACVFVADKYREPIERLQADLHYEEDEGIRGTVEIVNQARIYDLSEQDLVDGAAMYLASYHAFDPHRLTVELLFDETEGVTAVVEKM